MRVTDIDERNVMQHSNVVECFKCNEEVYISPSMMALQLEDNAEPVCNHCCAEVIENIPDAEKTLTITNDQWAEIKKYRPELMPYLFKMIEEAEKEGRLGVLPD